MAGNYYRPDTLRNKEGKEAQTKQVFDSNTGKYA